MRKELQLIELYCAICHQYDTSLASMAQRQSNNFCPKFTDVECMTTYIWGIINQKFEVKACYDFIKDYYDGWFPDLPSYQAYSKRICYLADAFKGLANMFLCGMGLDASHSDYIIDSVPIILASHKRSWRGKVAGELCDKGYCASKELHYYGMKLHILAQCNYKAMPTPAVMTTSKASCHDLPIAKEMLGDIFDIRAFGDKAFIDKHWQARMLSENNVTILTPVKLKKGQKKLSFWDGLYSAAVSGIKQAIESLNNWLIEKTSIQKASKVRSASGLLAFLFARISSACFVFNS